MYFRDFDERTGSSYPGLGDPESALRAFGFGFPVENDVTPSSLNFI